MPCDTIQTVSVTLRIADLDLLTGALVKLNLAPVRTGNTVFFGSGESFNKETGELRVRSQETVSKIKQAYSAQIAAAQAKRFGWSLKEIGSFQYEVTKR